MSTQKFTSAEDVLNQLTPDSIKDRLTTLKVKFHHNHKPDKLASLLFEALEDSPLAVKEVVKDDEPTFDKWASLVPKIEKEVEKKHKPKVKNKLMSFISKNFNLNLDPNGVNHDGESIRYVPNYKSLNIAEQQAQGDVFKLDFIHFSGTEGVTWTNQNGFVGRSMLQVRDETLQHFLMTNKDYNQKYALYDLQELQRRQLADEDKEILTMSAVINADDYALINTLSFMNLKEGGRETFDFLMKKSSKELQGIARRRVRSDIDGWLGAMKNPLASPIFLVNMAKDQGLIRISSDERSVTMASSGQEICKSSLATDWQMDMVTILSGTPEGRQILNKLEVATGVKVV